MQVSTGDRALLFSGVWYLPRGKPHPSATTLITLSFYIVTVRLFQTTVLKGFYFIIFLSKQKNTHLYLGVHENTSEASVPDDMGAGEQNMTMMQKQRIR